MKPLQLRPYVAYLLFAIAFALCLMLVGCGEYQLGETAPSATGTLTDIPVSTYNVPALNATIAALVQILPTASPIPGLVPEKAEGFQSNDLWERASGTALALYPPPTPPNNLHPEIFTPSVPLTPYPLEPHRAAGAGIIWEEGNPYCQKMISVWNQWTKKIGNESVGVCAGSRLEGDTVEGAVLVFIADETTGDIVSGPDIYSTPHNEGKVKIIDAVGEQLTLQAADGSLFYFAVNSRQWVSSPTASPSPVVSPLPSPSP